MEEDGKIYERYKIFFITVEDDENFMIRSRTFLSNPYLLYALEVA